MRRIDGGLDFLFLLHLTCKIILISLLLFQSLFLYMIKIIPFHLV